jgi:hypothetical protein
MYCNHLLAGLSLLLAGLSLLYGLLVVFGAGVNSYNTETYF